VELDTQNIQWGRIIFRVIRKRKIERYMVENVRQALARNLVRWNVQILTLKVVLRFTDGS
jgi:hypothetical protein